MIKITYVLINAQDSSCTKQGSLHYQILLNIDEKHWLEYHLKSKSLDYIFYHQHPRFIPQWMRYYSLLDFPKPR